MNPHRLCWGFAYDMPFAMIVAVVTLVSLLMSKEPKKIPWTRETILLLIFLAWMLLTTTNAMYPALAWPYLNQFWKIVLMVYVTMLLMQSKERIDLLVWVIALSIGFYGVKGGIFTIVHGGVYHVRGPAASFIGGDNEMGLALIMTIPLLRYLQLTTRKFWVRGGLSPRAMLLCAIATVGSQSRGALLGLVAMGGFLWLKSRNKFFTGVLGALAIALVLTVMPQQWYDRMATIQNYETMPPPWVESTPGRWRSTWPSTSRWEAGSTAFASARSSCTRRTLATYTMRTASIFRFSEITGLSASRSS